MEVFLFFLVVVVKHVLLLLRHGVCNLRMWGPWCEGIGGEWNDQPWTGSYQRILFTCRLWCVKWGEKPRWKVWGEAAKTLVPVYQGCLLTIRLPSDRRDQTDNQLWTFISDIEEICLNIWTSLPVWFGFPFSSFTSQMRQEKGFNLYMLKQRSP